MGELRTMGPEGDTKLMWDPDNPDEVSAAKAAFDKLMKDRTKRYMAFGVKKKGDKGDRIDSFDPKMGRIIIAPPIAGG